MAEIRTLTDSKLKRFLVEYLDSSAKVSSPESKIYRFYSTILKLVTERHSKYNLENIFMFRSIHRKEINRWLINNAIIPSFYATVISRNPDHISEYDEPNAEELDVDLIAFIDDNNAAAFKMSFEVTTR